MNLNTTLTKNWKNKLIERNHMCCCRTPQTPSEVSVLQSLILHSWSIEFDFHRQVYIEESKLNSWLSQLCCTNIFYATTHRYMIVLLGSEFWWEGWVLIGVVLVFDSWVGWMSKRHKAFGSVSNNVINCGLWKFFYTTVL